MMLQLVHVFTVILDCANCALLHFRNGHPIVVYAIDTPTLHLGNIQSATIGGDPTKPLSDPSPDKWLTIYLGALWVAKE